MAGHDEPGVTWHYGRAAAELPITFVDGSEDTVAKGELIRFYEGTVKNAGQTMFNKGFTSPSGTAWVVELEPAATQGQFWMAYNSNTVGADLLDKEAFVADTPGRQSRVGVIDSVGPGDATPDYARKGEYDTIGLPGGSLGAGVGGGGAAAGGAGILLIVAAIAAKVAGLF